MQQSKGDRNFNRSVKRYGNIGSRNNLFNEIRECVIAVVPVKKD
jgi:hypothetical protein